MFNWSLKLRQQTDFCIPKGPSFKRAGLIKFSIGGTEISLRAPRHKSQFAYKEAIQPPKECEYNHLMMKPVRQKRKQWLSHSLFMRSWRFNGPWFSGSVGELSMSISLITPSSFYTKVSFFRPKAFESAIADFLKYCYGHDFFEGAQSWLAPVDWGLVSSWPCPAATFYVRANAGSISSPDRYFVFPVTDTHFIEVYFNLHRAGPGPQEEKDQVISISPLEKLSTDIMNSIQVKLSPEALAQQAKALEGLEDTSLSESFPPIKFTTPEQDAEHERYLQEEQRIQDILNGK